MIASEEEKQFYKNFGDKLFEIRKQRGWTQLDLAKHLGCSRGQVANIETGRSRVDAFKLHLIAKVMEELK